MGGGTTRRSSASLTVAVAIALALIAGSAESASPVAPASEAFASGLKVKYWARQFDRLREFDEWMDYKKGKEGPDLPALNYSDTNGTVLSSTLKDKVAALIEGAIKLAEPGTYRFKVRSNDGVMVSIGGAALLKDDEPHKTRFSDEASLTVTEPGWYALEVRYFEKKGSAALELHWAPPAGGFALVPAEAFGHR